MVISDDFIDIICSSIIMLYKLTFEQICFFWWTCLYKSVQPFLHIAYSVGSLFEWAVRPLTLLLILFFFGIFVTKCNSKACDPSCTFDLVFNRNWVLYGLLSLFLCPTCAVAPVCCWYCYNYGVCVFVNFKIEFAAVACGGRGLYLLGVSRLLYLVHTFALSSFSVSVCPLFPSLLLLFIFSWPYNGVPSLTHSLTSLSFILLW